MDTPWIDVIRAALEPLCGELHATMAGCAMTADEIRQRHELTERRYNSLGADLTRALAYRELSARSDLDGWGVEGDHSRRGQLMLRRNMMRLRFLHDRQGKIPPAGRNAARRAYYRNAVWPQSAAFEHEASTLVAVWRVLEATRDVEIRVVRPIDPDARWGGRETAVDLDFLLPDTRQQLADLAFEQFDDDLTIEFPEDEEGTGEGQASGDVS